MNCSSRIVLLGIGVFLLLLPRNGNAQTVAPTAQSVPSAFMGHLLAAKGVIKVRRQGITVAVKNRYRLVEGDVVTLTPGASAEVIHYGSGTRYQLRPGAPVLVEKTRLSLAGKEARVLARLSPAGTDILNNRSDRVRQILGERLRSQSVGLTGPRSVGAMIGPDITLTWRNAIPAADQVPLLIAIRRQGEREPFVAETLTAAASSFPVPTGQLVPGTVYRWYVEPTSGVGSYRIEGTFYLLTPEEIANVHALEADAEKVRQSDPTGPTADLILADGYENIGLLEKALTAYQSAQAHSADHTAYADEIRAIEEILRK